MRKPAGVRRCADCVGFPRGLPRQAQDGSEVDADTSDLPEGIEIAIVSGTAGAAAETATGYGRSVHFRHGTEYTIQIVNRRKKKVCVDIWIDGRQVNLSPILLRAAREWGSGKPRIIQGLALERNTADNLAFGTYDITTTIEPFIAARASGTGRLDGCIGTIRFKFCHVKYIPRHDGQQRRQAAHLGGGTVPVGQGCARPGVLQTSGSGNVQTTCGTHRHDSEGNRKPVGDRSRPLEVPVSEITICERV